MSYRQEFLLRAIEIGELGLGMTHPNPIVGAVIVSAAGTVLGEGFHIGQSHAEVLAIEDAKANGHSVVGASLYCSLEPCNHHGKTPPCSEAIVSAGITEVFFALSDPNPVASGGASRLLEAGVRVEGDLLSDEATYSNRAWLTKVIYGRPRITVKIAQTLDGRVAASDGRSQWITSDKSREHAKRIRDSFDAICIGTGTALADNPTLRGETRDLPRFVLGARDLPPLLLDDEEGYEQLKSHNPDEIVQTLLDRGFNSVLIEGGPTIASAFLQGGVVDEIHMYMAPSIMGSGRSSVAIKEFTEFSQQLHYELGALSIIGGDIFAVYLKKESA